MASLTFASRFKNKIEKLGKNGIIPLNKSNFIEKTEIPLSKIHQPLLKFLPSNSKAIITQSISQEDKIKKITNTKYFRSYTPIRNYPVSRISPSLLGENVKRSLSPYRLQEGRVYTEPINSQDPLPCPKLPRINSGSYNLRDHLKNRIKHITIKNQAIITKPI
ncbi:hypothetical protein SteCoe_1882 [Stentor coeruleus]|uniref:Uncharacterized protein n=1 Tax=Stentor coeruleus TaxID=5963 RepID=A0A1R2D0T3_9CILI|nr:hypothetical protein SteCoe_1882 [Stentor coeruleus]